MSAPQFSCGNRRWSINRRLEEGHLSKSDVRERIITDELDLCTVAASRYSNNYCAWSHRQWVHGTFAVISQNAKVFVDEMMWSETYNQRNVSDHSGFQFRQYLLKMMMDHHIKTLDSFSWCEPLLTTINEGSLQEAETYTGHLGGSFIANLLYLELRSIRRLIHDLPGHETLWYHNRFIIHSLHALQTINSDIPMSSGPICKRTRTDSAGQTDCKNTIIENELSFIDQILANDPLHCLANRHKQWLTQQF